MAETEQLDPHDPGPVPDVQEHDRQADVDALLAEARRSADFWPQHALRLYRNIDAHLAAGGPLPRAWASETPR